MVCMVVVLWSWFQFSFCCPCPTRGICNFKRITLFGEMVVVFVVVVFMLVHCTHKNTLGKEKRKVINLFSLKMNNNAMNSHVFSLSTYYTSKPQNKKFFWGEKGTKKASKVCVCCCFFLRTWTEEKHALM